MDCPPAERAEGDILFDPSGDGSRYFDMPASPGNGTDGDGGADGRCNSHVASQLHRARVSDCAARSPDATD